MLGKCWVSVGLLLFCCCFVVVCWVRCWGVVFPGMKGTQHFLLCVGVGCWVSVVCLPNTAFRYFFVVVLGVG